VKRLELALRAEMDRLVRRFGVTTLQYTALSVLNLNPGLSSAQLARRSFVSAQAANELVAALERKNLIQRRPDSANRRILKVYLTEPGRTVLRACDELVNEMEARMLLNLTDADQRALRYGLELCVAGLRAERPDHSVAAPPPRSTTPAMAD
jgi:DNA-binding MarR family transcriptional regulator